MWLSSRIRINRAQKYFQLIKCASIYIQKIIRGVIQRPKYFALQVEAKEKARVNSKLVALQKRLIDAEMKVIKTEKARAEAENRSAVECVGEKKYEMQIQSTQLLDESTK